MFLMPSTQFEDLIFGYSHWQRVVQLLDVLWVLCIHKYTSLLQTWLLGYIHMKKCSQSLFEGNYHGLAPSIVLRFLPFHIRTVSSKLPFGSGPWPLLVPRLFSGVVARSKCWQRLLSGLTVWVDEFQGRNLCLRLHYILVRIQPFCANKSPAFSLWHLLMYTHLTNQIQHGWSETCISLPAITTSNECVLTATACPDLYHLCLSCRMIIWTSPSTLDSSSGLVSCLGPSIALRSLHS